MGVSFLPFWGPLWWCGRRAAGGSEHQDSNNLKDRLENDSPENSSDPARAQDFARSKALGSDRAATHQRASSGRTTRFQEARPGALPTLWRRRVAARLVFVGTRSSAPLPYQVLTSTRNLTRVPLPGSLPPPLARPGCSRLRASRFTGLSRTSSQSIQLSPLLAAGAAVARR